MTGVMTYTRITSQNQTPPLEILQLAQHLGILPKTSSTVSCSRGTDVANSSSQLVAACQEFE